MNDKQELIGVLTPYLPDNTAVTVANWIFAWNVDFRIVKPRRTKLGDYRQPWQQAPHRITVNNDLNRYAFLITVTHEFAHLQNWENNKNKVKPHGAEWKAVFRDLLVPFLHDSIFPDDVHQALEKYMSNPAASSCTDVALMKVLRNYNPEGSGILLEEIPENSVFSLNNKRLFIKGEKLRKRFKCRDLSNNRYYLISPIAEVQLAEEES